MGVLLNGSISFVDTVWRIIPIMIEIVTVGWYFIDISKYLDKRKYATKRINTVVSYRKKSRLIGVRSFRLVCYYVYTFTGLDEYEGITFYDNSVKLEEQYQIGEIVSLYINPENLGQFWVEKATEPDRRMILWIVIVILTVMIWQ